MKVKEFQELFGQEKPLIGMVHLLPLPGSPRWEGDLQAVITAAVDVAVTLETCGFGGLIVENYGDVPFFPDEVEPETIAAMTAVTTRVRNAVHIPIGVNVLRNDAQAALAIAAVTGALFIRVNVFVGTAFTDQGIIEGKAALLLRSRRQLGKDVKIFADVMVKHAQIPGNSDVQQVAEDAYHRGLADALIFTGPATGKPADLRRVQQAREVLSQVPILIGSGVNAENLRDCLQIADGVIVGTSIKVGGVTQNRIDRLRAQQLVERANRGVSR